MKSKLQKMMMFTTFLLIIVAWGLLIYERSKQVEHTEQVETEQSTPLTISTKPKSTIGTITIYDADGEIQYQYSGDFIHVDNSGWNGEYVEINVYIPYAADSCFDDEGRLKN